MKSRLKIVLASSIAALALTAGMDTASAQSMGGTGRPSYDNPSLYDRDAAGNETYYPRGTYFGQRYYYDDDEYRPARKGKKVAKKKKQQYYDDDDD